MFPVWDFVVGIFARKSLLNMSRVLSTSVVSICMNKQINNNNEYKFAKTYCSVYSK